MNGDFSSQGNQASLYAISPESIQPQYISPGSIQPQPVGPQYPPFPGFPPGPQYPGPQYPPFPSPMFPPYQPQQPYPRPPYQPQPYPPYPGPGYPTYPSQPTQPYPPTSIGGCNQKWATVRTSDGRRLNIYVTSISEDSIGGFLPDGRQIALDYDEIVEMTC